MVQVPTAVIEAVASTADLRRFRQYALRSYVEDNRKLTWCGPAFCKKCFQLYLRMETSGALLLQT